MRAMSFHADAVDHRIGAFTVRDFLEALENIFLGDSR